MNVSGGKRSVSWRPIAWFILGCAGVAGVLGILYVLLLGAQGSVSAADTANAIRDTQVSNHALLDKINSCTDLKGKCFRDGQRRAAKFGDTINQEAFARSACGIVLSKHSRETDPVILAREIASCTKQTLAELEKPGATP